MASSALTHSRSYSSYRSTSGLQDWRIHYNASSSDFTTKKESLGLALSRTHTASASVLINNARSKRRRNVRVS
jgi:hypothetical protein